MKILLLYPKFPKTFWGFKYALPFIGKKASFPPLGLLTVAALLPKEWEKKVLDLNIQDLSEEYLNWADFIFISAMIIQKESVREIIDLAKKLGKKIVAGGPLFTTGSEDFLGGKTGTSPRALENLVALFSFGKYRVVLVLLGSDDRAAEAKRLLEWVHTAYANL